MSKVESRSPPAPSTPPKVETHENKAPPAAQKKNEGPHKTGEKTGDKYVGNADNKGSKVATGTNEQLPASDNAPPLNKEDASGVHGLAQDYAKAPNRTPMGHAPALPDAEQNAPTSAPGDDVTNEGGGTHTPAPGTGDVITSSPTGEPSIVPLPGSTTQPDATLTPAPSPTPSAKPAIVPTPGSKPAVAHNAAAGGDKTSGANKAAEDAAKKKPTADTKAKAHDDGHKKADQAQHKKASSGASSGASGGAQGGAKKAGGSGGGNKAQENKKGQAAQKPAANTTKAASQNAQASSVAKAYRGQDAQAQKQALTSWSRDYQTHYPQSSKASQLDELRKQLLAQGLDPSEIDAAVAQLSEQLDASSPDAASDADATQDATTTDATTDASSEADASGSNDDTTTSS